MSPEEKIARDVAAFLESGGQITRVDSSHNADANTRFVSSKAGPRYVDKKLAAERQNTHNKVKRKR